MAKAPIASMLRDLYRRRPEARNLLPWELQTLLWSLGYADDLLDEDEIAAAVAVVRPLVSGSLWRRASA